MLAVGVKYLSSIQDIILDIYNGADHNFSINTWPFPDYTLSQLIIKLREKKYFRNKTNEDLKKSLKKIRCLFEIRDDVYRLFIQIDDICPIGTNPHFESCYKLHWINNCMICNLGINLKTYTCPKNSKCSRLHISKQYLFDRILSLLLYLYIQFKGKELVSDEFWLNFSISLDQFIENWKLIFKLHPVPVDNENDISSSWMRILKNYNNYYDPIQKKYVIAYKLHDNSYITFKCDKNKMLGIICWPNFFDNFCYNDIYHPRDDMENVILHPTLCDKVHISLCIKRRIYYIFKNLQLSGANLIHINLHHGLYRLKEDMMVEKNGYLKKYSLLSLNGNLIKREIKDFKNIDFFPQRGTMDQYALDNVIDNGYHNPNNWKLIRKNIILKSESKYLIKSMNKALNKVPDLLLYDANISTIQKNIIIKFLVFDYFNFMSQFLNIFRLINSRCCWGRRKTIYVNYELNNDQDILIIEFRDVNLLINSSHLKNWFYKILNLYEYDKYGTTNLNKLITYLESYVVYTQTMDVNYSVIDIYLIFNPEFDDIPLFNHCDPIKINYGYLSSYDPTENGRFIQHLIPQCYHSFRKLLLSESNNKYINKSITLPTSSFVKNKFNNVNNTNVDDFKDSDSDKLYNDVNINEELVNEMKNINLIKSDNNINVRLKQIVDNSYEDELINNDFENKLNHKKDKFNENISNYDNDNVNNNINDKNCDSSGSDW